MKTSITQESETLLFIGGPSDGKRDAVPNWSEVVEVPLPIGLGTSLGVTEYEEQLAHSVTYRRFRTAAGFVMVAPGIDIAGLLERLLAGYVPGVATRGKWGWGRSITNTGIEVDIPIDDIMDAMRKGCQFQDCAVVFSEPTK